MTSIALDSSNVINQAVKQQTQLMASNASLQMSTPLNMDSVNTSVSQILPRTSQDLNSHIASISTLNGDGNSDHIITTALAKVSFQSNNSHNNHASSNGSSYDDSKTPRSGRKAVLERTGSYDMESIVPVAIEDVEDADSPILMDFDIGNVQSVKDEVIMVRENTLKRNRREQKAKALSIDLADTIFADATNNSLPHAIIIPPTKIAPVLPAVPPTLPITHALAPVVLPQSSTSSESEMLQIKFEVVQWLQSLLGSENITSGNLFEQLKSGVLLCKALNTLMLANPSFTEQNLPTIEVGHNADTFTYLQNLCNFTRTCELYFNVDRERLFDPVELLKTQDERMIISCLHFIKLVVEQNGLKFPTITTRPFVSLTFDQLSTLVSMLNSSSSSKPLVAYDPRVVMSVQDTDAFQQLSAKIGALETSNKTLQLLNIGLKDQIDSISREQNQSKTQQAEMIGGVLRVFQDISIKINQLTDSNNTITASIKQLKSFSEDLAALKKTVDELNQSTSRFQTVASEALAAQAHRPATSPTSPSSHLHASHRSVAPPSERPPAIPPKLNIQQQHHQVMQQHQVHSPASPPKSPVEFAVPQSPPNTPLYHNMLPVTLLAPAAPAKVFKLPAEVLAMNLSKEETMRQNVIYEILDSETDYVRDLNVIIEVHMKELKAKGLLNDKEIKAMFGNMEELLPVHQNLLQLINKKREESPVIGMLGDVLLRTVDTLKVYDTYCTNYPMAMQLYKDLKANREEMRAYLGNTVNVTEFRGLSLESFLIKPVQRICKYPLLLKELVKNTPKDSKERVMLEVALGKIEEIVSLVNERTGTIGNRDKLAELQTRIDASPALDLLANPERSLLKDGIIQRYSSGKSKEKYVALLSDMIIICKPQLMNKTRHQFETFIDLTNAYLNISVNSKIISSGGLNASKMVKTMFEISVLCQTQDAASESFIFSCASEQEQNRWVTAIEEAINVHTEERRKSPEKFQFISPYGNSEAAMEIVRQQRAAQSSNGASANGAKRSSTLSIRRRGSIFGRRKVDSQESLPEVVNAGNINEDNVFTPSSITGMSK